MLDVQSTLWLINGRIQVTMMDNATCLGARRRPSHWYKPGAQPTGTQSATAGWLASSAACKLRRRNRRTASGRRRGVAVMRSRLSNVPAQAGGGLKGQVRLRGADAGWAGRGAAVTGRWPLP